MFVKLDLILYLLCFYIAKNKKGLTILNFKKPVNTVLFSNYNSLLFIKQLPIKNFNLRLSLNSYSSIKHFSSIINNEDFVIKEVKDKVSLYIKNIFLNDIKYLGEYTETKLDCIHFNDKKSRNLFRKELVKKSGIYMLKYKHEKILFYIGKALDLSIRLRDHYTRSYLSKSRLGLFIKLVGWSNISVHVIEFCSETQLDIRESFLIKNIYQH